MECTALIAGASGLVGGHCLKLMLADPDYSKVISLVRRPSGMEHPKLNEVVVSFDELGFHSDLFAVNHVYCCLGTTIKTAGSKEAFRKVDQHYPVVMAELADAAGADSFAIVTALGSDSRSMVFYNKVKGEVEDSLRNLSIPSVSILQPSLLMGERTEKRLGEGLAQSAMKLAGGLFLGPLKKYKGIEGAQVAKAMVQLCKASKKGYHAYPSDELQEY